MDAVTIDSVSPTTEVAVLAIADSWKNNTLGAVLKTSARMSISPSTGGALSLALYVGPVAAAYFSVPADVTGEYFLFVEAFFNHIGGLLGKAHIHATLTDDTGAVNRVFIDSSPGEYDYDIASLELSIRATPINFNIGSLAIFDGSLAFGTGQQT
jgi:hypothetical protein